MKKQPSSRSDSKRVTAAVIAALCLLAVRPAMAATDTWTGGASPDGNWTTANNWGGVAPSANDQLNFTGSIQLLATNNFPAGTIFNNLFFDGSAGAFTLSGNSLVLTNGTDNGSGAAVGGGITNSSSSSQTISLPITLSVGRHNIANNGGGQLNLNGLVTRNTGAVVTFDTSGGAINVTGGLSTNGQNNILGGWAILGNDWATLDASSNVVAYSGYTDVTGAPAIANNAASNVRWTGDTGNATAANGTVINSFLTQQGATARTLTIATGGILKLGARGGIYRNSAAASALTVAGGFLTANGGGEITLLAQPGTASGSVVVSSVITNDGPANVVSVNVFGYVTLNGNVYSGGTYINQGRVTYNASGAYGFGPVFVYPGGESFENAANCTNALFLLGNGSIESNGGITGPGALRLSGRTHSGKVTLMGPTRITTSSAGGATIISGQITGTGPLEIATFATAASQMQLANTGTANDWTGGLTISSLAASRDVYVKLGANNQIPDGASAGNVTINSTVTTARLDLNGFSDTINGLIATNSANHQVANFGTAPSTLTLGNNNATASYGGTFADNGTVNRLSIVKIGTGTQTFTGANTRVGDTTVSGGTLVIGATSSISSSTNVMVNTNSTLDVAAICPVTQVGVRSLTSSNGTIVLALQSSGGAFTTPTLNALGSTNFVTITAVPAISSYPAIFSAIKYTTLNGTLNFGLAGSLPASPSTPYAGYVSNNVANNSVDFVVTAGPVSVKWAGYSSGAPNSAWDIGGTANWRTGAGAPTTYSDGSFANFDDSASNSLVTLSQDVSPAGITVANNALTYTCNGGSKLTGEGSLSKQGPGKLILANTGLNDFTGGISIAAGTLQIGNNDGSGNLPAAGIVTDNGALVFDRTDTITDNSLISGSGTVSQTGSGTLTLSGANTFTGAVTVVQGTLITGSSTALGTTNGGTIVSSGATLDIGANAINLGQERITISGAGVGGAGALINSSGSLTFTVPNAARLTLAGNSTVGGSGRLDLRSATTSDSTLSSLSTGGQPFKLTKVGAGTFGIVGCTVDPLLGDIEIQQGILGLEAAMTGLGNPASNLYVWPGGTLQMFAITNKLNKVITLGGDGVTFTVSATSGNGNTIIGPMNITNDCLFNVNSAAVVLTLNNTITGPGKITKAGSGLLTFAGNSPNYDGGIQLNSGNVALSGTLSNSLGVTLALGKFTLNGTLLGAGVTNSAVSVIVGSGTNAGPMDVSGALNPGDTNVVGTLTTGGLVLEGGAILNYDLASTTTPGGGTNDLIVVNGDLVVNGNAITINPLALLKTGAGNPYRLFNYTGNLIWNADLSVSAPGTYTFTIDTNTPGQVNLVASGGPPVWNGGSSISSLWTDANNWSGVTLNPNDTMYFDGVTRLINTNNTTADTTYTDIGFNTSAGAFVLNGNPITLAGNVINSSTNVQTINLGLSYGTSRILNGGAGGVIIGGGATNTASTTLTLAGNGILTNLLACSDPTTMTNILSISSNANWTLKDNPASLSITTPVQLDIVGTLNFGVGSSAPSLASTASANNWRLGILPGAPATLNMVNGTLTTPARLNTGAATNTVATLNQSGGTINVALFQVSDSSAAAFSTVNVTGGTFNVFDTAYHQMYLASRGTGIVTVATSGVINCSTLDLSRNAAGNTQGSIGVVNLNGGGTIACSRVGTATSASQSGPPSTGIQPSATFNFNGGTLKATASSTTYFQGNASSPAIPIKTIVKSGGAIIDSDSNSISVLEPLQHDSGLGTTPDGGLIKKGSGMLTLTAASTYTGDTVVSNGTLLVSGSLGATAVIVATNATLAGTGSLGSYVTVNVGGTISPAAVGTIGTFTVASNVVLQGTTAMDINQTAATNDVLKAGGSITYGGTLVVTNLAGTLTGSETFKLFTALGYNGAFSSVTPAIPAVGLAWNTNTLTTDGILRLVVTVNPNPTNITTSVNGSTLTLSWPSDHIGWRLQSQTNSLAIGLSGTWTDVAGATTTNLVNVPLDPANGSVFYRMVYP